MVITKPDIFISYSRADKAVAQLLADALANEGWNVWWDRDILPGEAFAESIETALDSAGCLVVLWSKTSVASGWVKTEAAEGLSRRILIPVLIEDVKIPLEFRRIETANLSDWQGSPTHPEFGDLLGAIRRMMQKSATGELRKKHEHDSTLRAAADEEAKRRADEQRREDERKKPPVEPGFITRSLTFVRDHRRIVATVVVVSAIVIAGAVWLRQANSNQGSTTNTPNSNTNQLVASSVTESSPAPTPPKAQASATVTNESKKPPQEAAGTSSSNGSTPQTAPTKVLTPAESKTPENKPSPTPAAPQPVVTAGAAAPSGKILNGRAISLPQPAYPPMARAAHAAGPVIVQVVVDENGDVISAKAMSGHPLLQAPSEAAARQAKFAPLKLMGQPVKVSGVIQYNFTP
jgi:TonB family protein